MRNVVIVALFGLLLVGSGVRVWQVVALRYQEPVVNGESFEHLVENYMGSSAAAGAGIEKLGTNAIPTLLRMLCQKDSKLKGWVMERAQTQHWMKISYVPSPTRNQMALFAFLKLGPRAQGAVPDLIGIYKLKVSSWSQQCAVESLSGIGPSAHEAIPVLAQGMTNSFVPLRRTILLALIRLHSGPDLVIPSLTNALNDSDAEIRNVARMGLWLIGGDAKQSHPILVKMFSDSDPGVRGSAAVALTQIAAQADSLEK